MPTQREARKQKVDKILDAIYAQKDDFTVTDIVIQSGGKQWRRTVIWQIEDMIHRGLLSESNRKGRGVYYKWVPDE